MVTLFFRPRHAVIHCQGEPRNIAEKEQDTHDNSFAVDVRKISRIFEIINVISKRNAVEYESYQKEGDLDKKMNCESFLKKSWHCFVLNVRV